MRVKELYLFTYTGKTSANVLQEACRFLKEELDKLLPKYGKLHKKTSTLFDHPKLASQTVAQAAQLVKTAEPRDPREPTGGRMPRRLLQSR